MLGLRVRSSTAVLAAFALLAALLPRPASSTAAFKTLDVEVIMPPYETHTRDSYLCMRVPLPEGSPEDSTFSLVGFEPIAEQSKVHHMLLFGCQEGPANTKDDVWDCAMRSTCKDNDVVLYGWGLNAPPVTLPAGSGYTVGSRSSNKYLVLQIHFLDVRPLDDGESGIRLKLSTEPLEQSVSLQAFARGFMVPPGRPSYKVSNECCYNSAFPMTSFASRVHTHALGRKVSLDVRTPSNEIHRLVVDSNPLEPQGFYPVNKTITILPGDRMEMTCDFDSSEKMTEVYAGQTHEDEMCNLYLMAASPVASFSMCVMGSHLVKQGQGLGTNIVPHLDTIDWDSESHHARKGFGQIPGLFYSNVHPESVWMFYRRDSDWVSGTFDSVLMRNDGFVRGDTISLVDLRTGEVKKSLGAGMFMMPHMISEAEDGTLWVTDVGAHLVRKLDPDTGMILATLGGGPDKRPNNPGSDADRFCKPTEAIETRDGRVLVSDGYCNNRVMEFDAKTLRLIKEHDLGTLLPDGIGTFGTWLPHSLAYDECTKTALVALRIPRLVVELDLRGGGESGSSARRYDLKKFGEPMAVRNGMYGAKYVLTMGERETHLVELNVSEKKGKRASVSRSWQLDGPSFPHDFVFVPGPEFEDGTLERNVSLIVSETRQRPGSQAFKYVFHDAGSVAETVERNGETGVGAVGRSDGASAVASDAVIHLKTDDLVLAAVGNGATSEKDATGFEADVGNDTNRTKNHPFVTSERPTPQRINIFGFSLGLSIVVLWGFLQTLGITMRSLKS